MIRFAIIGTNWITKSFIEAAEASGKLRLAAVYSRSLTQARDFVSELSSGEQGQYGEIYCTDDLPALAAYSGIDAVYMASPNAYHFEQAELFIKNNKHVFCEKPLASNHRQVTQLVEAARQHQVVLFEGFKTAYLPNFHAIQQHLPRLGQLRRAFFNYCQYSSRYPRYLAGENPNTFNPAFSNGSIMDIGYYCLAMAVALWGAPRSVEAKAVLLSSGVDAMGTVYLDYGDLQVELAHSKVSDSVVNSEIQGEEGSLLIEKLSQCTRVILYPRGADAQDVSQQQYPNTMQHEAEHFAALVEQQQTEHTGLAFSLTISAVLDEIRKQTGVVFPADTL